MTVTVREMLDSRPFEYTGGKKIAYRMFSVEQDSPALSSPDEVINLMGSNGLPKIGDTFPGTTLEAFDYKVSKFEGQTDLFLATFIYRDAGFQGVGVTKQPGEDGYVEYGAEVSVEFQPAWRRHSATEFEGLVQASGIYAYGGDSAFIDVAGDGIDAAGEPISIPRRTITLTLGVTVNQPPSLGYYTAFTPRRNNTVFGGFPIGSLLYTGANVNRIDTAKWNVEHRFVWDQYYHLVQNAHRNPNGAVRLLDSTGKAEYVWFVQPFPTFANFYAIDSNFAGLV
jgi:hypothetical protein